jgi:cold shock protein
MDSSSRRTTGVVRQFDRTRGLGTIEEESGTEVLVRYSAILGQGVRTLKSGDRVAFEVEENQRGRNAVRVMRI